MESNKDDSNQLGSLSEKNDDGSEIGVRMEQLIIGKRKSKTDVSFPTPNVFSKNDFEVVELLGKGAYAKVVKAVYTLTKEVKAIKIIDKTFVERVSIININYRNTNCIKFIWKIKFCK